MAFKRCGAKTRANGHCRKPGSGAGDRCRLHGGASPVGPASPHFKHGRRSKLLREVKGLGEHYQRALDDPDLLSLHDEIAVVDARINQLFERAKAPRTSIDGLWPQLDALFETRRKLVDTEAKRLKDLHAMVSVDRVMLIVSFVADSVKKHVTDRGALNAIFQDLRRLLKPEAALSS